jgi:hypothetical protein
MSRATLRSFVQIERENPSLFAKPTPHPLREPWLLANRSVIAGLIWADTAHHPQIIAYGCDG